MSVPTTPVATRGPCRRRRCIQGGFCSSWQVVNGNNPFCLHYMANVANINERKKKMRLSKKKIEKKKKTEKNVKKHKKTDQTMIYESGNMNFDEIAKDK